MKRTFASRPTLLRGLRILAALTLLGVLAYNVDWRTLPDHFQSISWPPALLAFAGLTAHFFVSPWKWQAALRMHGLRQPLGFLVRANGIGFFFNNFLPSGIGGDAYRVMSTWPKDGHGSRAVSAVVIERIVGLMALLTLGNLGALFLMNEHAVARAFIMLCAAFALAGGAMVWAMYAGLLRPVMRRISHTRFFAAVSHNLDYLQRARSSWLRLISLSLLFQMIAVANIYFLFQGIGTPVPLLACAVMGAVAGLAAIVPLSINGIGIVEGSFAGTAVALGVDYEAALAVSLLIRVLVLPGSLIFGVMYACGGDTRSPLQIDSGATPGMQCAGTPRTGIG